MKSRYLIQKKKIDQQPISQHQLQDQRVPKSKFIIITRRVQTKYDIRNTNKQFLQNYRSNKQAWLTFLSNGYNQWTHEWPLKVGCPWLAVADDVFWVVGGFWPVMAAPKLKSNEPPILNSCLITSSTLHSKSECNASMLMFKSSSKFKLWSIPLKYWVAGLEFEDLVRGDKLCRQKYTSIWV